MDHSVDEMNDLEHDLGNTVMVPDGTLAELDLEWTYRMEVNTWTSIEMNPGHIFL